MTRGQKRRRKLIKARIRAAAFYGEQQAAAESVTEPEVHDVDSVSAAALSLTPVTVRALQDAGYETIGDIRGFSDFTAISKIGVTRSDQIVAACRRYVNERAQAEEPQLAMTG